jgi:DNA-binding GntR family transcriptional regulator
MDGRTGAERAELEIRRLIFTGALSAGDRIPQDEIARSLGISRIPLREALIALEREGWTTIEPYRGAFVNALDERAVRDHYALYGITYGFAVERALDRSEPVALAERLERIRREAAATDDLDRFEERTIAFHAAIVSEARSERIKVVLRAMPGLVPGNFFAAVPGSVEAERAGFASIVAAVAASDATAARGAYATMMRVQGDLAVEALRTLGLFGATTTSPAP